VSFVKTLSFIDDGLWGFETGDADGYVLAFFQLRNKEGYRAGPTARKTGVRGMKPPAV
jgi:hypothetical protein